MKITTFRVRTNMPHFRRNLASLVIGITTLLANSFDVCAEGWSFDVSFSEQVRQEPFTGRVYVIFTKANREPRQGPSWFQPELFAAKDVTGLKPGEAVTFDDSSKDVIAYPEAFKKLDFAGYRVQAVMRFNPYHREIGVGEGNGYGTVVKLDKPADKPVQLMVTKLVTATKFKESKWTKLLQIKSKLLGQFHGRDVEMAAAVILPASYFDEPNRRYPTIFTIPGFGGTHHRGVRNEPVQEKNRDGVEFLRVLLDPSCPLGHHVFADSANNGPVGQALIDELIPALDREFRSIAKPTARFLTGHSSGGWSSLWIQVAYPDHFAGTWSTAPDPVDFHDFQRIDLYRPRENMYVDGQGERRPLARVRGQVMLWYRGFADMEWVLGPGGQLHSFEATFSPRGKDGKPSLVWDRKTGAVNTEVAKTWEKYDIRLILERNWKTLGPKLKGKLHVFMGDMDTFYLEGATIRLKESLAKLKSDAVVDIYPGKDHFNLLDSTMQLRIRRE
ncbi:MAG: alpha/beta hydrolase-fold protein, partial [Planctomycetota bacterium]|nr:alpha/beta hydrolase-fold protein [Planctomycetota bacterium]